MLKIFAQKHKHPLGAFVILIVIATVSGYFAFKTTDTNNRTTEQQNNTLTTQQNNTTTQNTRLSEPEAQADGGQAINKTQTTEDTKLKPTASTASNIQNDSQQFNNGTIEQSINKIILRINDKDYTTKFTSSTSVYDLMNQLQFEHKISFSGKEYTGMGLFVEEINGVKNDNLAGKYWIYYINGQSARVGISSYIIKPNDLIEWKYETTNL